MIQPYAEVIGDPISQSKSPLIHGFWLAKLGIDADYRACHVLPEELADYFAARRADPLWRGCNVTMPHKLTALALADRAEPSAVQAGAANVIRPAGGALVAANTDVDGVAEPLRKQWIAEYPNLVAVYAQIIGAGGAARAAVCGLRAARACSDISVFVRTPKKAHPFAAWANTPFGEAEPLGDLGPIRNPGDGPSEQRYSHIVINATSMGMTGQPPVPIDLAEYYPDTIVFDMVYAPLETPLLRQARACGLRTIDGLEMLIGQASTAFAMFFGQPAPREHDAELRALLTS